MHCHVSIKAMTIILIFCITTSYASNCVPSIKQDDNDALVIKQIEALDRYEEQMTKASNKKLLQKCKELFVDVAQIGILEFFIFSLAVIAHEVGHLIAAQSLLEVRPNEPITVDIGTYTPQETPLLFSWGNIRFYRDLPWTKGQTSLSPLAKKGSEAFEKYRNFYTGIIIVAGGLSGAAFLYMLLVVITAYCAYADGKGLSEVALKSFINAASPFSYIVNTKALSDTQKRFLLNAVLVIGLYLIYNIFYGCTPYRAGDGVRIWKKNLGVTGSTLEMVHCLSALGAWGCWALLVKNYCDARKKFSSSDSQMPLLVALISLLSLRTRLVPKLA
ncbi:MAG: hypothetical protein WCW33_05520 [Candidatus Babeliales bacterium]